MLPELPGAPKEVRNPELAQQLVDMFDLKGTMLLKLEQSILPVVISGDLRASELRRPAWGGIPAQVAAGAANQWNFGVANPTGSGVLVFVTGWSIELGSAGLYQVRVNAGAGTAVARAGFWRDGREAGAPAAGTFVAAVATAVLIEPLYWAPPRARLNETGDMQPFAILSPGDELRFIQNTANDTIGTWAVEWEEVSL